MAALGFRPLRSGPRTRPAPGHAVSPAKPRGVDGPRLGKAWRAAAAALVAQRIRQTGAAAGTTVTTAEAKARTAVGRLTEVEGRLLEAEAKAQKSESRLSAAEERLGVAERKALAAEAKARAAQRELRAAQQSARGVVEGRAAREEPRPPASVTVTAGAGPGFEARSGPDERGRVVVSGRRGVQVGEKTLQTDHCEFELTEMDVDIVEALLRPRVRRALTALAADPWNPSRRRDADAALSVRSWFAAAPSLEAQSRPPLSARTSSSSFLGDWLIVRDSAGVQTGNNTRQSTFFLFAARGRADAGPLLHREGELRAAVIDHVLGVTGAEFHAELRAALGNALSSGELLEALPEKDLPVQLSFPCPGNTLVVHDRRGVTIGRRHRQLTEATVT
jgi:hypothetical protein